MRASERFDAFARSLEPLPESGGLQLEDVGRFRGGQVQDFAKHVGESMRPVQTLQHSEGAADLDLFRKDGTLLVSRAVFGEALGEVRSEGRKAQLLTLDTALLDVEQVVRSHAVCPG